MDEPFVTTSHRSTLRPHAFVKPRPITVSQQRTDRSLPPRLDALSEFSIFSWDEEQVQAAAAAAAKEDPMDA